MLQRSGSTCKNHKSPSTTNLRGVLAYMVAFLIISGLIAELVINDPGIELNPGPNSPIKYTPTEAKLMRAIKQLNTTIARLSSHQFFNKSFIDLQLTPKTLYNDISHTPAKPHPNLLAKLQHLKDSCTSEALNTYNEHYTEVVGICQANKTTLLSDLSAVCSTTERYNTFNTIVISHYNHHITKHSKL